MIKNILIIVIVVSSFASLVRSEEKVVIDENGVVMVDVTQKRNLSHEERLAYENPETEIPINLSLSGYKKDGFFYDMPVYKYDQRIVFKESNFEIVEATGEKYGAKKFAKYIVSFFMMILFMAISNAVIKWLKNKSVAAALAIIAAVAAFIFAIMSVIATATLASVTVPLIILAAALAIIVAAAALAFGAPNNINLKVYISSSAIFYIVAMTAMFV